MTDVMTSLQRVLTTLSHREPDRVPFFLLSTMHGAKELGQSIQEYFSRAENVVEGQLRLLRKYRSDCIYTFFYASLEAEAWGSESIFVDDGPPNAGAPALRGAEEISRLVPPRIEESAGLCRVLEATREVKAQVGDSVLVLGVVMAPFSLPVMQMGFEHYLDLMCDRPDLLQRLLKVNEEFCVAWANAQIDAGAGAICFFDPVCSTTIVPAKLSRRYAFPSARSTIARVKGPVATHIASGCCLSLVDDIASTGTLGVGVSAVEDLKCMKNACRGRLGVVGNLNAMEMRRWTTAETETAVKNAIAKAGPGGGYILADNHGEIPFHVQDETLMALSEAVHRWGHYPLEWVPPNHER